MHTSPLRRCLHRNLLRLGAAAACLTSASTTASAQEFRAIPSVRIAAVNANNPTAVGSVSSVVQLSNGSLVVADNINYKLHFYTAGGRFVRSVGRDGSGPGEFRTVRWIGECARDSVFAFDYMQSRISVFAADGQFVRSFSVPTAQTALVRCGLDGTMAYVSAGDIIGTTSRGAVQTYSRDGKLLFRSGDVLLDDGRPLGRSMKISIADSTVIFGSGDSAFVTAQTPAGTARKKLAAGLMGRVPTDLNRSASLEYWATYLRGGSADIERTRQFLNSLPPVKALPAYSDMFVDGVTKSAWVQTSVLGDPATVLQRVGFDGVQQGRVSLPPNLIVQQIRGDVVVAKMMNPVTGDESVVTYRIAR